MDRVSGNEKHIARLERNSGACFDFVLKRALEHIDTATALVAAALNGLVGVGSLAWTADRLRVEAGMMTIANRGSV